MSNSPPKRLLPEYTAASRKLLNICAVLHTDGSLWRVFGRRSESEVNLRFNWSHSVCFPQCMVTGSWTSCSEQSLCFWSMRSHFHRGDLVHLGPHWLDAVQNLLLVTSQCHSHSEDIPEDKSYAIITPSYTTRVTVDISEGILACGYWQPNLNDNFCVYYKIVQSWLKKFRHLVHNRSWNLPVFL